MIQEQGISWAWIIAIIIFVIIVALAWKYWPATQLAVAQTSTSMPVLQNSTVSNSTPSQLLEQASADDALAGLSDRLKG